MKADDAKRLKDLERVNSTLKLALLGTAAGVIGRHEVLFVTDDPASAAEATLRLLEIIDTEGSLPRVHAGLAFGPVLYRGGDVFGPVVNIAARIASLARQDTIRVDEAMATALVDVAQFTLTPRLPRRVRGYLQLRSYRLRRAHSD